MSEDLRMWDYWRDKKGTIEALLTQYPALLKSDPVLQQCVAQIEVGMIAIDARMNRLASDVYR